MHRTVLWVLGCLALLYVTCGAPAAYGRLLFSAHMVGHMTLSMVAPLLLVLGAPGHAGAARPADPRGDGSRGPREWVLAARRLPSRSACSRTRVVVAVLFAGSLVAFYYSPLFGLALRRTSGTSS